MTAAPPPDAVQPLIDPAQRDMLIAATVGSIVSLFFLGERVTWVMGIATLISGCALSYYGVPIINHIHPLDPVVMPPVSFVTGLIAMPILGGLLKLVRMWRDNPDGFIQRFIPFFKKGGGQ